MTQKPHYYIDGEAFSTLEEFAKHFSSRVLGGQYEWNGNLDAFNDILRGGFGTPADGFVLVWLNSALSRQRLGYEETVRQLEKRLLKCDPASRQSVAAEIDSARQRIGPTLYGWLVEIIRDHGAYGKQHEDGVQLELH